MSTVIAICGVLVVGYLACLTLSANTYKHTALLLAFALVAGFAIRAVVTR